MRVPTQSLQRLSRASVAAVAIFVVVSCGGGDAKPDAAGASAAEAALMQRGTNMLYQGSDPVGAEAVFREVLQRNASHYGARYQLAVALDRGGKPVEARGVWETVLGSAETIGDSATMRTARARLAVPDTASEAAMMALGLDLLYRQSNPTAAAEQFRKVLQKNAAHYGATYQLATALDRAGQRAQATPIWQRVLGMAVASKDTKTAETARTRLR